MQNGWSESKSASAFEPSVEKSNEYPRLSVIIESFAGYALNSVMGCVKNQISITIIVLSFQQNYGYNKIYQKTQKKEETSPPLGL